MLNELEQVDKNVQINSWTWEHLYFCHFRNFLDFLFYF